MKNNLKKRMLSALLSVVMVFGMIPYSLLTVSAEEMSENSIAVTEDVQQTEENTNAEEAVLNNEQQEATEQLPSDIVETTGELFSEDAEESEEDEFGTDKAENTLTLQTETKQTFAATVAETECTVADDVIDITDYTVATWSRYTNKVTNITVSGGNVKSATEEGTTINILMSNTTDSDAELGIVFGKSVGRGSMSQSPEKVTLENGKATVSVVVNSSYAGNIMKGSVTFTIKITTETAGTAEIENISISRKDGETDFSVNETQTLELKATVTPDDAKSRLVLWSSLDESIATVDEKGVVKGIDEGTVTIRATSDVDSTKYGECLVTVLPVPENQMMLDITTSKGSVNHVTFTDAEGKPVEFVSAELDNTSINVILPKSISATAKITAAFDLTQTDGYPFLTTKTGTSGTSANKAVSNKFTQKEITLSEGKAAFTFYLYNQEPKTTSNVYTTYTLNFSVFNNVPKLSGSSEKSDSIVAEGEYKINLDGIFTDADGDELSYKYSTDGTNYTAFEGSEYTFSHNIADEYKLYFKAYDGQNDSEDIYTVTITVENAVANYHFMVKIPQDITPAFYVTSAETETDGTDKTAEALTAEKGETKDGFTAYKVTVPDNIGRISVRGTDSENKSWGGMCFDTKDAEGNIIETAVTMVKVQGETVDYSGAKIDGTLNSADYTGYKAVKGENGFLLCADMEYIFEATPANTQNYVKNSQNITVTSDADVFVVQIELPYNNPFTITAPTGAKAQLYSYVKYYNSPEYTPFAVKDNGDGTSTTYFLGTSGKNSGGNLLYRVTYKDYIVKAGWATKSLTVTFDENDLKSNARVDYKNSTASYAQMAEDNVLLNINGQNNLAMKAGDTKNLKAYRAWEIIPVSYNNFIITPDFHYNIISGGDVVKLTDKKSLSTTDTDWKTLTAVKEGTAVIEVSYDAIQTSGYTNGWNGVYGATDPARTGLMVVQVGGHDSSVNFNIDCFASQGNMDYTKSTAKQWDAEFDTLYFVGENGQFKLSPTANSAINSVQISADKGESWTTLTGDNGTYTAPIAHGNNIIRVVTDNGTAYQVVRGYRVSVSYKITNDNGNGVVDKGETVRVTLSDIHQPIPKFAGVYNPGYRGNYELDGGTHIRYTFNGQLTEGNKTQYLVPTAANYIDVTIPEDTEETSFTLTGGYIATAVIGFSSFVDGGQSHRNNPDDGRPGGESTTTQHTRSMLPDITINIGEQSEPNSAPYAKEDAVVSAQIELGQTYVLNPETLFADADDDILSFTYAVNGTDKGETDKTFRFTPDAEGDYVITFTASDGKLSAQHTLTLTVVEAKQEDTTLTFDIDPSDIKGYVTVGFEDNGIRAEGEHSYKYPVPLGTIIEPTKVPFAEGETIAQITIRLLDAMNIGYEYTGSLTSGFYLGAIKNIVVDNTPYDSLGQFDAGEGSGWMITSNDWFIDQGASDFAVNDGDKIQWKYTCQLGADIGDNSWEKVVGEVETLIDAIGLPVTLESADKIAAARTAYDALSEFHKSKVSNYSVLVSAEEMLQQLIAGAATEADKSAAAAVDKLIEEIGTVTLESAEKIQTARKAYENLTTVQKQFVTKLAELETAENLLKQLNNAPFEEIYEKTGSYISSLGTPSVGTTGGEWMVIGLARGSKGLSTTMAEGYFNGVLQYISTAFEENENLEKSVRLHENKSTDNSRVILGLTAAGYDATDVNGYNLFDGLDDMDYIRYQGVNGPMWALIALNCHPDYKDELSGNVTEETLINAVLASQLADGGWDLSNTAADTDMTAMAVQSLAPYYNTNEAVKAAVDKALGKLSSMQLNDGGFASVDGSNAESVAQVIVALTALGINPEEDARFIKKGMSAVDALSAFAMEEGGFRHTSEKLNGMATEQGYYALVSYFRMVGGQTSLYDMSDITLKVGEYSNTASAYDIFAAEEVEKLIGEIGEVTINSGKRIEKARTAYDKLTDLQKQLVENYKTLEEAEKLYDELADKAVKKVMDLIDKIGEVDLDSDKDIAAAKLAYNQLPDELKELVENYDKLKKAEKELKNLREEALSLLADGKLVLSKTELLELKDKFEQVTENTGYDAALALLRTFHKLGEIQQLALENSNAVKLAQSIVAKHNHTNSSTGINAEGLEWNIRLVVEETKDKTAEEDIRTRLENGDIVTLWDIYLEDVLTGEKHTLKEAVQIKMPLTIMGDYTLYDYLKVIHYTDDGRIELLNCDVADGYVVFNAADFSWYGVVGFINKTEDTLTQENPLVVNPQVEIVHNSNSVVWLVIAAAGIAVLAVLFVIKKHTEDKE